jgi:hypothetical protein
MNTINFHEKLEELKEFAEFTKLHDVKMALKNPYKKAFIERILKYSNSENGSIKLLVKSLIDGYDNRKDAYFLVTINPKECEINELQEIINHIQKRHNWVKIMCYTFEQRSTTYEEMGKGKHIHMIIKKNKRKSEVIRELYNSLKNNCETNNHINVKLIKNNMEMGKVEQYMKGKKKDKDNEDKLLKCSINETWRLENNLLNIYYILYNT